MATAQPPRQYRAYRQSQKKTQPHIFYIRHKLLVWLVRWCAGSSAGGGDGTAACTAACDYKKMITGVLVLACARARCLQCNLYPGSSLFVQVRSTTSSHSFFVRCSYEFASCSCTLLARCSYAARGGSYERELTRELRGAPVCVRSCPWIFDMYFFNF
jgi:hypothetical protein